jgi:amidohydrolase
VNGPDVESRIDAAIDSVVPRLRRLVADTEVVPELGFFEYQTSELARECLEELGFSVASGVARTGLVAEVNGSGAGPRIAIMAELDALPAGEGPAPARHMCGHNLQLAILVGVAAAVRAIADRLDGAVRLLVVPAEEMVDIDARLELREQGSIEFLSGKAEFARLGQLDGLSAVLMAHSTTRVEEGDFAVGGTMNGLVSKRVRYLGRSSHAGAAPEHGINALDAALQGLAAINAMRATFRDADRTRVHSIISEGGAAVNVITADVLVEVQVRGATVSAIEDASQAVDRALASGALSVGARVEIDTVAGYLPLVQDASLIEMASRVGSRVLGEGAVRPGVDRGGSTDLGDLSALLPVLQVWTGGVTGELHRSTFALSDFDRAVVAPARVLARSAWELLRDGAALAREVRSRHVARFTIDEYVRYLRREFARKAFDGSAALDWVVGPAAAARPDHSAHPGHP